MSRPISLRTRLSREYAGIALLTALLLGAILALVLPPFLTQLEMMYLQDAGRSLNARLGDTRVLDRDDNAALQAEIEQFAQINRVSVSIFDETGAVLAEYSLDDVAAAVSDEELTLPLGPAGSSMLLQAKIAGGPDAGAGLITSIAWAWAIAGSLAVVIAALFGYILAGRVSAPIAELTRASGEMAAGDLSVRATVKGDTEVQQLASAFNEMAEGIEDTFDSLRRFTGDAAHEIGTPLTALQADLELAQDASGETHVRELLERSLGHSERVGKLTRDLLALSRLESVGAVAEQQRVDLKALAEAAVDSASSRAERAGVNLTVPLSGEDVQTLGDPLALSRALGNLVDNALKFTPAGGKVEVSVGREGNSALLRVADTGLGIAEKDMSLIFERFHRARSAAAIPGSGLGLAIVKAIVDAHRGEITVSSDEAGTVFEIRLPAAQ
ncbi:MAG: ATP-binding protein [Coriobacteriia bacterium]|nr:ATP-binding protein [Coriobacteriia bacterium]